MINWIKKVWTRLRAPECSPITVTYCKHRYEELEVSVRVSEEDLYASSRMGPAFLESYVRRQLCNELVAELCKRVEVFAYTNHHDPLTRLYTARIKILLDNGKETK
jgi:hypothetical protein